jgi:hypothetical protein
MCMGGGARGVREGATASATSTATTPGSVVEQVHKPLYSPTQVGYGDIPPATTCRWLHSSDGGCGGRSPARGRPPG